MSVVPQLRTAVAADSAQIAALMRASVLEIFPGFYSPCQTAAAAAHIAVLDPVLIADGTYFVYETDGRLVACGGWSRRRRLFAGPPPDDDAADLLDPAREPARVRAMFVRRDHARRGLGTGILAACEAAAREAGFTELALMATLPGVPLYLAYGFTETARTALTMPDGVALEGVTMAKTIA
jgi:GNAT superfamily N-acetyltransferase